MTENTSKTNNSNDIKQNLEMVKFPSKTMKNLYSIKDVKAGFITIFIAGNDLLALRYLNDDVNNPKSPLNIHAEDYELYKVGEMCYENGELQSETKFLARAIDYKKTQPTEIRDE